jgi:hypothetical protein
MRTNYTQAHTRLQILSIKYCRFKWQNATCIILGLDTFASHRPGGVYYWYVRFEVSTAVTMKNVVFWDIKVQFVLHRRHITSPLESSEIMLCKI